MRKFDKDRPEHDLDAWVRLIEREALNFPHTGRNFSDHVCGVYALLRAWGCSDDVCAAGFYHSIYGTDRFRELRKWLIREGHRVPKGSLGLEARGEIVALIGERADRFAFANCALRRTDFDRVMLEGPPYILANDLTGDPIELSEADFLDLAAIHLADWLEQVPRTGDLTHRRAAYERLATLLGGESEREFWRIFTSRAP